MKIEELTIREGIHGGFFYHIAEGKVPLCGDNHTMITKVPLSCWGIKTHLNERYCSKCEQKFKERKNIIDLSVEMAKAQKPSNKIIKFLKKLCRKRDKK